jgi:hypothetical protein
METLQRKHPFPVLECSLVTEVQKGRSGRLLDSTQSSLHFDLGSRIIPRCNFAVFQPQHQIEMSPHVYQLSGPILLQDPGLAEGEKKQSSIRTLENP